MPYKHHNFIHQPSKKYIRCLFVLKKSPFHFTYAKRHIDARCKVDMTIEAEIMHNRQISRAGQLTEARFLLWNTSLSIFHLIAYSNIILTITAMSRFVCKRE